MNGSHQRAIGDRLGSGNACELAMYLVDKGTPLVQVAE